MVSRKHIYTVFYIVFSCVFFSPKLNVIQYENTIMIMKHIVSAFLAIAIFNGKFNLFVNCRFSKK